MKIIIDENIEFGIEAFSQFGQVERLHGRKITNSILKDVEILIVRSITKVNKDLLEGTPVKFVGTTTIGTDHIDINYLNEKGITYASAPGCNSFAVTEYVFTALFKIAAQHGFNLSDKSISVIGYGNIGTKVTRFAKTLGMKAIVNDPPLQRKTGDEIFSDLNEALQADIITCHVPLNKEGIDKTVHLLDEVKINSLKQGAILINSSRGPVVDNSALLNRINKKNDITVVLDVWENEPKLNQELLEKVFIASPHIAGYSLEGKVNGTVMVYDQLCKFLGETPNWQPALPGVTENVINVGSNNEINKILIDALSKIYPIEGDSAALKSLSKLTKDELAKEFDLLRKNYNLRREFNNYKITSGNLSTQQKEQLKVFRFGFI